MTDVSDVLRDRMQQPSGLQQGVTISFLLHGALFVGLLLAPQGLLKRPNDAPRPIMSISLGGGGAGTSSGGMTSVGGRAVQVQTPPEETPKREAVRPPAAKAPEMTSPAPGAKSAKASAPVTQAPDEARGRTPTRGPQARSGSAIVETEVRGLGFGLSTGGGPGTGSTLDVADFCCPQYLAEMIAMIRRNWVQQAEIGASVIVKFTIERDGLLTQIDTEKRSGNITLDLQAERAVVLTKRLRPLPQEFPNPTLTVHLNFQYQR
jgi:TonB family protein